MSQPHNVAFLERAIRQLATTNEEAVRMRATMANVIAGQFLVGAVMRGGGALKLRYGESTTRYTMDFDAARRISEDEFVEKYNQHLARGWNDFSGRLVIKPKPHPRNIPAVYVMQPFEVKLTYRNHPWCTVDLEVSYDEVGDADMEDRVPLPESVLRLFSKLDFPMPEPVPLMRIEHQIAQKLHGVTDPRLVRVQDLIDLQLMMRYETVDLERVGHVCQRLFANRRQQPWPSVVQSTAEWEIAYNGMKTSLEVLPSLAKAIDWVNDFITRIVTATGRND